MRISTSTPKIVTPLKILNTSSLVVLITDKIMAPRQNYGMGTTLADQEALKKKLDTLTLIPKKKYPYPMTSSQEVGWDNDEVSFDLY